MYISYIPNIAGVILKETIYIKECIWIHLISYIISIIFYCALCFCPNWSRNNWPKRMVYVSWVIAGHHVHGWLNKVERCSAYRISSVKNCISTKQHMWQQRTFWTPWRILDVNMYFWRQYVFLTGELFNVMTCLWGHDEHFDFMTCFLTSWRNIATKLGRQHIFINKLQFNTSNVKDKCMELMSIEWHNDVSNRPKLRTYRTFKQRFGTEHQK